MEMTIKTKAIELAKTIRDRKNIIKERLEKDVVPTFEYRNAKLRYVYSILNGPAERDLFEIFCEENWDFFMDMCKEESVNLSFIGKGKKSSYDFNFETYDADSKYNTVKNTYYNPSTKELEMDDADLFDIMWNDRTFDFYNYDILSSYDFNIDRVIEVLTEESFSLDVPLYSWSNKEAYYKEAITSLSNYLMTDEDFDKEFNGVIKLHKYLNNFKEKQIFIWDDYKLKYAKEREEQNKECEKVNPKHLFFNINEHLICIHNDESCSHNLTEMRKDVFDIVQKNKFFTDIASEISKKYKLEYVIPYDTYDKCDMGNKSIKFY